MATQLQTRQDNPLVRLNHELKTRAEQFKMALPSHITPEKFQRTIMTAVQQNPKLLEADRQTFMTSCMKAAQDGLVPDGREAALVEFKTRVKDGNNWVEKRLVQYMPMVYGLRKKILQSGEVKALSCNVVYRQEVEAGLFVYEEGTERMIRHKPSLDPTFDPKDEDIVGAYSVAVLNDNTVDFVFMRRSEINKVRSTSQTGAEGKTVKFGKDAGKAIEPKGPWVDWFSEMAKKTVMRRHSKTLPMSGDIIDLEATGSTEEIAANSTHTLLGSAEEAAPTVLPSREETAALDYDPSTGEVLDGQANVQDGAENSEDAPAEQEKPKRARAKQQPSASQTPAAGGAGEDTPTSSSPDNSADERHPAQDIAEEIIADARVVKTIIDLNSLRARTLGDLEAMPEEIAAPAYEALDQAEARLKGGK